MKNLVDNLIRIHIKLDRELKKLHHINKASNGIGGDIQEEIKGAIAQFEAIKGIVSKLQ